MSPNLEKMVEQKALRKFSNSMLMLLGLHKLRDRQLVGLMNQAVIPIQLVNCKNFYQHMIKTAKSPHFGKIMNDVYNNIVSPLVDMFTPYPIPVDHLLKESATQQGEIEVIGLPSGDRTKTLEDFENAEDIVEEDKKTRSKKEEKDAIARRNKDIDALEAKLREQTKDSFSGPADSEAADSPFISFRRPKDTEPKSDDVEM